MASKVGDSGAKQIAQVKVGAGGTQQVRRILVGDGGNKVVWEWSDPVEQTFLPVDSSSFRIVGGGYTTQQKDQRRRLAYYGESSVREEGSLTRYDQAAIAAFLAVRPAVTSVKLRTSYQHSYAGGETVTLGWHGESSLDTEPNDGWVEPFAENRQTKAYGKSTAAVRVENTWTGAQAIDIAAKFANGTYHGHGVWKPDANDNDWGWGVGADEKSTSESAGSPNGFTPTTVSDRIELLILADFQ